MKRFLCALAALPLFSAAAFAQPAQLSDPQMDTVSAGWALHELDVSNTSWTEIGVYTGLQANCPYCYLTIVSPQLSIQSNMGPTATFNPLPSTGV